MVGNTARRQEATSVCAQLALVVVVTQEGVPVELDLQLVEMVQAVVLLVRGRIEPVQRMVGERGAQLLMAQVLELQLLQLLVVVADQLVVVVMGRQVVMVTMSVAVMMMVLALGAQINGQVAGSGHVCGFCDSIGNLA